MASLLKKIHSPEDIKGFDGKSSLPCARKCVKSSLKLFPPMGATWPPIWVLWNLQWL